jgi:fatty acid desaturase
MEVTALERALKRRGAVEWPTLGLAVLIYGAWLALTFWHDRLPVVIVVALGAWLVAWQSSLQHEIIHGHPTRWRAVNTLLGFPPLSLWIPFERYRRTHLAHHRDEHLTDPLDDPESYYWSAADWRRLGASGRLLVRLQTTLPGRMLIGPAWSCARFLWTEARAIAAGDTTLTRVWMLHLAGVAGVLAWVLLVARMPLWLYLIGFAYAGTSLMLIRSFAEHRALPEVAGRTAIVERAPLLGLLFLYNNLHVVHHRWPTIPWYRLPAFFKANRAAILASSSGPRYASYVEVARRFWRRPHDSPVHPFLGRRDQAATGARSAAAGEGITTMNGAIVTPSAPTVTKL